MVQTRAATTVALIVSLSLAPSLLAAPIQENVFEKRELVEREPIAPLIAAAAVPLVASGGITIPSALAAGAGTVALAGASAGAVEAGKLCVDKTAEWCTKNKPFSKAKQALVNVFKKNPKAAPAPAAAAVAAKAPSRSDTAKGKREEIWELYNEQRDVEDDYFFFKREPVAGSITGASIAAGAGTVSVAGASAIASEVGKQMVDKSFEFAAAQKAKAAVKKAHTKAKGFINRHLKHSTIAAAERTADPATGAKKAKREEFWDRYMEQRDFEDSHLFLPRYVLEDMD